VTVDSVTGLCHSLFHVITVSTFYHFFYLRLRRGSPEERKDRVGPEIPRSVGAFAESVFPRLKWISVAKSTKRLESATEERDSTQHLCLSVAACNRNHANGISRLKVGASMATYPTRPLAMRAIFMSAYYPVESGIDCGSVVFVADHPASAFLQVLVKFVTTSGSMATCPTRNHKSLNHWPGEYAPAVTHW